MPDITVSSDIHSFMQSSDKEAMRTNAGLGASDTVSFGSFVPPSGTTAEINAVTNATVGAMMINTDTKEVVRFTSANAYETISPTNALPIRVSADAGAVGSAAGTPFKSGFFYDFELDKVLAGEEKTFVIDIFFNLEEDASGNISPHNLDVDLTLSEDIGDVGAGAAAFASLDVDAEIKTLYAFYGPFPSVPNTTVLAQGGIFGATNKITGTGMPYNSRTNNVASLGSSSGDPAQILAVKTLLTVRRNSLTNFNFALPMRLTFTVREPSNGGLNSFGSSEIFINAPI